jgi:hypothetical protein
VCLEVGYGKSEGDRVEFRNSRRSSRILEVPDRLQTSGKGSRVDGKARGHGEEWKRTGSPLTRPLDCPFYGTHMDLQHVQITSEVSLAQPFNGIQSRHTHVNLDCCASSGSHCLRDIIRTSLSSGMFEFSPIWYFLCATTMISF